MPELATGSVVRSRAVGDLAVIYAGDYLNKLSGERIERECRLQLERGCRALIINFRETELVNSIGVSILLGVIDAVQNTGAQLIFSDVNHQTVQLFEMLGLTRHVALAADEAEALATLSEFAPTPRAAGH
ncbi:MAG TPA: STAS domain-containing protein [Pyrinomonadaceae bacterium]|jgi:anti-anti-sigma factor